MSRQIQQDMLKLTRTIAINKIKIGDRVRKDPGDLTDLVSSIREMGLLHPVVIDMDNNLVAGYRRICACSTLGLKSIPFTRINIVNLRRGEYDENIVRKDFTPSEAVAILETIEQEKGSTGGRPPKKVSNLDTLPKGRSTKIAKKVAGYSHGTLLKIKKVVEASRQDPKFLDVQEKMDMGELSIDRAFRKIEKMRYRERMSCQQPKISLDSNHTKLFNKKFQDITPKDIPKLPTS